MAAHLHGGMVPAKEKKSGTDNRTPIIVAVIGLAGVLVTALLTNWDKLTKMAPSATSTSSAAKPDHSASSNSPPVGQGLKATANEVIYTVRSGRRDSYSDTEYRLVLDVVMSCGANGENFTADVFRLEADGVKYAPIIPLSERWIDTHSDWAEKVTFAYPKASQDVKLQVGRAGSPRVAVIPLPSSVLAKWD